MAAAPTREQLIKWAEDAWRRSDKQRELDKEMDDTYFSRHAIDLPKATENLIPVERKTSLASDLVQRVKATVMSRPPSVNFRLGTMNQEDTRLAEEVEEWIELLWARLRTYFDVWNAQCEDMIRFGRGISIVEYVPEAWASYPRAEDNEPEGDYLTRLDEWSRGAGTPLSWRHVPAPEFVPIPNSDRSLRGGFWFGYRYAQEVLDQYGRKATRLTRRDLTPLDKIQFVTYADANYTAYLVGDIQPVEHDRRTVADLQEPAYDVVRIFKHPLGMVPWSYMRGQQGSSPDPILENTSVLYFISKNIRDLDSTRSARATTLWNYTMFPPLVFMLNSQAAGRNPTGDDHERPPLEWKQGGSITLWKDLGESMEWPNHPGVHASLDGEIQLLMSEINRLGQPPLELADPSMSGVARNIAMQIATSKYGSFTGSMSMAAQGIIERFLAAAKLILKDAPDTLGLYVDSFEAQNGWVKILPKHLRKPFRVFVTIPSPVRPDLLATVDAVQALRSGPFPFLPDETLYEELMGYTNPAHIQDLLRKQDLERDPEVSKALREEVIRRLNLRLDAEDLIAARKMPQPLPSEVPPALAEALALQQAGGGGMGGEMAPAMEQPLPGAMIPGRVEGQLQDQQNILTQVGI